MIMFKKSQRLVPAPNQLLTAKVGETAYPAKFLEELEANVWKIDIQSKDSVPSYPERTPVMLYWGTYESPQNHQAVLLQRVAARRWIVQLKGEAHGNTLRQSPRIPITTAIRYGNDPTYLLEGTSIDISRTGCRFYAARPFASNDRCYCVFTLGNHLFKTFGRVMRVTKPEYQRWDVAVQFVRMPARMRDELDEQLQRSATFAEAFDNG